MSSHFLMSGLLDARQKAQQDKSAPSKLGTKVSTSSLVKSGPTSPAKKGGSAAIAEVVTAQGSVLDQSYTSQVNNFHFTFSVWTQNGVSGRGHAKENQDAWVIRRDIGGINNLFLGIFDGHGSQGKAVSNTIASKLPRIVEESVMLQRRAYDACLYTAFPEANAMLRRVSTVDCDLSGSTGVVALVADDKITVANLGDSRCILGRVSASDHKVTAYRLTNDHTPELPLEAQRVLQCGGRIATFMNGNEPIGPPRVWLRDVNLPGLCMTRSFGDNVGASVGVIDKPEVVSYEIDPADRYLLVMSDGIFEFMENQEVMELVHMWALEGSTPLEVSQRLVREARKRWMREEEEVIDDCTVIVSYLDHKPDGVASNLAAAQPPLSPTKRTSGGGAGSNKGTPTRGGVTPRSGGH